MKFIDYMKFR